MMGKDKDKKPLYNSKDKLKSDNLQLTLKIKNLDSQYKEIQDIIVQLKQDYELSKGMFPTQRYKRLKDMIKQTTADRNIKKAHSLIQKDDEKTSSVVGGLLEQCKKLADAAKDPEPSRTARGGSGGSGGLLASCKTFAGIANDIDTTVDIKNDLSKMSKEEIAHDNELKEQQIEKYPAKFLRAYNRLDKLKRDYEQSKTTFFIRRYGQMKAMIKLITTDSTLINK